MRFGEVAITTKRGKILNPSRAKLEVAPKIGQQIPSGWINLLVKCRDDERDACYQEIASWLQTAECDAARFLMYGVFAFEIHSFRTDVEMLGVSMYFVDYTDGVHLKLCMADRFG